MKAFEAVKDISFLKGMEQKEVRSFRELHEIESKKRYKIVDTFPVYIVVKDDIAYTYSLKIHPKILIVEDSNMMIKVIRDFIDCPGCEIFEAKNGDEGVRRYIEERPSIVFMDIIMSDKADDGITALKRIKQIDSDAVVIMVTSVTDQNAIKQCVDAGASEYITKPFQQSDIKTVLDRYFS